MSVQWGSLDEEVRDCIERMYIVLKRNRPGVSYHDAEQFFGSLDNSKRDDLVALTFQIKDRFFNPRAVIRSLLEGTEFAGLNFTNSDLMRAKGVVRERPSLYPRLDEPSVSTAVDPSVENGSEGAALTQEEMDRRLAIQLAEEEKRNARRRSPPPSYPSIPSVPFRNPDYDRQPSLISPVDFLYAPRRGRGGVRLGSSFEPRYDPIIPPGFEDDLGLLARNDDEEVRLGFIDPRRSHPRPPRPHSSDDSSEEEQRDDDDDDDDGDSDDDIPVFHPRRGVPPFLRGRVRRGFPDVDHMTYEQRLEFFKDVHVGLSESQINRYPLVPFHKTSDNEGRCTICLCDFEENEQVLMVQCFHQFHADCIKHWLKENTTCPICRIDLRKTDSGAS